LREIGSLRSDSCALVLAARNMLNRN